MARKSSRMIPFGLQLSYGPLVIIFLLQLFTCHYGAAHAHNKSFHSIYAFGDSLTDTGNLLLYQLNTSADVAAYGRLPFGETFFHRPTGRVSDGRLIIDFLANRVKAPYFLLPYLGLDNDEINDKRQSLVNFAVGGATAQNADYLNATYNISAYNPYSIDKQLQWFSMLPISKDKEAFSEALVYFGQIGVNDYTDALQNGFSIDHIISKMVPNVINIIENSLEFLIERGARYLVVEGGYPIGCMSLYTRHLFINAVTDKYGCVEELHKLNEIHDTLLKQVVQNLTTKYNQDVHITFFDQLKAYAEILKHPSQYGFTNITDPCFDWIYSTNLTNVQLCPIPSTYTSWDGIHYTEASNNVLLNLFYTKGFVTPYPNFLTL